MVSIFFFSAFFFAFCPQKVLYSRMHAFVPYPRRAYQKSLHTRKRTLPPAVPVDETHTKLTIDRINRFIDLTPYCLPPLPPIRVDQSAFLLRVREAMEVRPKENDGDQPPAPPPLPLPFFFPSAVEGVVGDVTCCAADAEEEEEEVLRAGDRAAEAEAGAAVAALVLLLSVLVLVLVLSLFVLTAAAIALEVEVGVEALPLLRFRPEMAGSGRLMRNSGAPGASVSSK
jgi:hypothetical protein